MSVTPDVPTAMSDRPSTDDASFAPDNAVWPLIDNRSSERAALWRMQGGGVTPSTDKAAASDLLRERANEEGLYRARPFADQRPFYECLVGSHQHAEG